MMSLRREDGITLVELLISVAISSMVAGGLGAAVHQFITTSERTQGAQDTLHDIQNTGHWLSLDGKKATSTDLSDGAPTANSMTLTWTIDDQAHNATYLLSGSELRRNYDGTVIAIARNVTSAGFSRSGQLITVDLTSTSAGRWNSSKQAVFNIWLRPAN